MNKHSNLSVQEDGGGNRSITGKFFQGAIPSPDSMKEYQEVDPSILYGSFNGPKMNQNIGVK